MNTRATQCDILMDNPIEEEMDIILNEGLIACVQRMPILWDKLRFQAADTTEAKLNECWNVVAENLGLAVTDAQDKWNKLRDGYAAARELVNTDQASKSSSNTEHENRITCDFPHYNLMGFLDDYLDQVNESSTLRGSGQHSVELGADAFGNHTNDPVFPSGNSASFERDVLNFLLKIEQSGKLGVTTDVNCGSLGSEIVNNSEENSDSSQNDLRDFLLSIQDVIIQIPHQHRMRVQEETLEFLESKLKQFNA